MIPIFVWLDQITPTPTEFFTKLFEDYYSIMKKIAMKLMKDKNTVDDVVQAAFESLIKNYSTISELDCNKLSAYVVSTIRRKCYDLNRKDKRRLEHEVYAEEGEDEEHFFFSASESVIMPTMEELIEMKEEQEDEYERLGIAMDKLKPKPRDALLYKVLLHESDEDIGKHLNLAKDSVRVYVKRAKESLKKAYTEGSDQDV